MERFWISYRGPMSDGSRTLSTFFTFDVVEEGEPEIQVGVEVGFRGEDDALPELALSRLEHELRTVGSAFLRDVETKSGLPEIPFPAHEIQAARGAWSELKECVWQQRAADREWYCVADVDGISSTTPNSCGGCAIPDERVICAHLMKPGIAARRSAAGSTARLVVYSPGCLIGNSPGEGHDCRLGGKECWQRRVETNVRALADPPADLPRAITDELDFLQLVARDRLGIKAAVPVRQARTIAQLFGECKSQDDFHRRLAAIGDMISGFGFIDALAAEDQTDETGAKLASLNALDKVLEVHAAAPTTRGGPVASLRSIVKARSTWPIHSQDEARKRFRELGIDYPPADWSSAWTLVLTALWDGIHGVREALQTVSEEPPAA